MTSIDIGAEKLNSLKMQTINAAAADYQDRYYESTNEL